MDSSINKSGDYFDFSLENQSVELLRLLRPVLRARDFHLYLETGKRLTDLWLNGGRAVIGHKPPQVIKELKNAAERGLFAPFPHPAEYRFLKALAKLFPPADNGEKYCFRIYSSENSLQKALENAQSNGLSDTQAQPSLWRPFLQSPSLATPLSPNERPLLIPVLPWPFSPLVLVLDTALEKLFPPDDLLSPVILATATRAIYDLIAVGENGGRPIYQKINKALKKNNTWQRQGIYLYNIAPNNWTELWKHFLERGFLLPPSSKEPLILPGILSPGEEAKLAQLLSE